MPKPHRRDFYRIHYPVRARPLLRVEGRDLPVLDLSEEGLRYLEQATVPPEGDPIHGAITMLGGERVVVEGLILRVTRQQVAVRLIRGVPLRLIIEEQRLLHERFGHWL